jgi:hypothetical protein
MPVRRSPNGVHHPRSTGGRDPPNGMVAINRSGWSQSIVIAGRIQPVRAGIVGRSLVGLYLRLCADLCAGCCAGGALLEHFETPVSNAK